MESGSQRFQVISKGGGKMNFDDFNKLFGIGGWKVLLIYCIYVVIQNSSISAKIVIDFMK
jgi:hypothetical protein